MKKYLFAIVLLFFLPAIAFGANPSFEIYGLGQNAWPTVKNVVISEPSGWSVTITADVFDVSGIGPIVAIIRNASGEVARSVMLAVDTREDGAKVYEKEIDVSNTNIYPAGNYTLDILATDVLGNSATYSNAGTISVISKSTQIIFSLSSSYASGGENISMLATLTNSFSGEPMAGKTITFTDTSPNTKAFFTPITATTDASGVATVPPFAVYLYASTGTHNLRASFVGDTTFSSCDDTEILIISKKTKISYFSISPASADPGASITLSATVAYDSGGSALANQMISFRDETAGVDIGYALTGASGQAAVKKYTLSGALATAGNHTISATFAGNESGSVSSATKILPISVKTTQFTAFSINPSGSVLAGNSVAFSATLKYADGSVLANQLIRFSDKTVDIDIGTATTNSSGVATVSSYIIPSSTFAGPHTFGVNFDGTTTSTPAQSATVLNVVKPTLINAFSVNPTSAVVGTNITLSATLSYIDDTPVANKTIVFSDTTDSITLGTATTNSSGVATVSYAILDTAKNSSHTLRANFAGDTFNLTSSNTATLSVSNPPRQQTQVTLFSITPASANVNTNVSITAKLTYSSNGTPVANKVITFTDTATLPAVTTQATTNSSGVATVSSYTIPISTSAGSHTVRASFAGDTENMSSFATTTISVIVPTSITPFTVSPASGKAGDLITFSATLKYADGTSASSQSIKFYLDSVSTSNLLGTVTTNSSGVAGLSYTIPSSVSLGQHNIIASFAGTSTILASSASAVLTVNRGTQITLSASPISQTIGSAVTFTATLSYIGGGAISNSSISFSDTTSGANIGTATTNSSGVATKSYTIPTTASAGSHTITANYAGAQFVLASSKTTVITVTKISTRIGSFSPASGTTVSAGSSVTLSASLVYGTAGYSLAGQTLTFKDTTSNTTLTAVTNSSGVATTTYTVSSNAVKGTHNLTVTFAGTSAYSNCSGSTTINVVNSRISTFTVTPTTISIGASVSLSAKLTNASGTALSGQTISFTDTTAGATVTATTNTSGVAVVAYTVPPSTTGTHNITASFAGTSTYSACSASATLNVTPAMECSVTDLTLNPAGSSGTTSTAYSFSAKLKDASTGAVIPSQQLSFNTAPTNSGSLSLGSATTNSSGVATTSGNYHFPSGGTFFIRARFIGNSTYPSCTSGGVNLSITVVPQPEIRNFTLTPLNPNSSDGAVVANLTLVDARTGFPMPNEWINLVDMNMATWTARTDSNGAINTYVHLYQPGWNCLQASYEGTYGSAYANSCAYVEPNYSPYY